MYFECKAKFNGVDENGKESKITELTLIDALSFTEAEARAKIEYECNENDIDVLILKKSRIAEVFEGAGDVFYVVTVCVSEIQDNGKKKDTNYIQLYQSVSIDKALSEALEKNRCILFDWRIKDVKETKIVEIFEQEERSEGTCLD